MSFGGAIANRCDTAVYRTFAIGTNEQAITKITTMCRDDGAAFGFVSACLVLDGYRERTHSSCDGHPDFELISFLKLG